MSAAEAPVAVHRYELTWQDALAYERLPRQMQSWTGTHLSLQIRRKLCPDLWGWSTTA